MALRVTLVGLLAGLALWLWAWPGISSSAAPNPRPMSFDTATLPGASASSESRVAVAPNGTEYVVSGPSTDSSARATPVRVWASTDGGRSWHVTAGQPVQISPTPDTDIVVTSSGRIIVAELDSVAVSIVVSYSDDGGRSWHESSGADRIADQDRPWLATGPDGRVYLLFHNAFSGNVSENMYVETSTNEGASFGLPVPLTTPGTPAFADLQCGDSSGPSSLTVNEHTGRLYAVWGTRHSSLTRSGCGPGPIQPETFVAVTRIWTASSPDNALGSWTDSLAVDDSATGNIVGMQVSPGALDRAGNFYVVYPQSQRPFPDFTGAAVMVRWAPPDLSHWSAPIIVATGGPPGNVLTDLSAGSPGILDVAWMAGSAPSTASARPEWFMTVAHITGALGTHPRVTRQRLQPFPGFVGSATDLMGWCDDTTPVNESVPACSGTRTPDMFGTAVDAHCHFIVTWSTVSAATDPVIGAGVNGTFVATQSGGPTLCPSTSGKAARCVIAGGPLHGGRIGAAGLGMTRTRLRRLFPGTDRRRRNPTLVYLCRAHRGLRVGFPSAALLRTLVPPQRARIRGRAVLLLTADRDVSLDGVSPGTPMSIARRHVHVRGCSRVGRNLWCRLSSGGVLQVVAGSVQQVGFADRRLVRTPRAARRFFVSFRGADGAGVAPPPSPHGRGRR